MKRWLVLIWSLLCFSSVVASDMETVVDRVVSEFALQVTTATEFEDESVRENKYRRAMQIGSAYLENGYKQDALRKFVYAFRIQQDSPDALFMMGTILIELKEYESAVAIFEHLSAKYPSDFRLNNNLGWIYCTSDDPRYRDGRLAEEYAAKALLYAPQDFHVWSTLAEARYVYGNYKDAVRAATQALMLAESSKAGAVELEGYAELLRKCKRALVAETELAEIKATKK